MSQPPTKRQRTDSDASMMRSEVWYKDGSVVLQTENTQFRVHFSVLALNSPFFRDLQDLPQPLEQPTVEGCPVIELQDACIDVKHLLNALYDPLLAQKILSLEIVGALIRLGRKYLFRDLFHLGVEILTVANPLTLREFKALDSGIISDMMRLELYEGIFFDIVTLASQNDLFTILPTAHLRLLRTFHRHRAENPLASPLLPFHEHGTTASLSPADLRTCVIGYQQLVMKQFQRGYTLAWLREPRPKECRSKRCAEYRGALLEVRLGPQAGFRPFWNPGLADEFCPQCVSQYEELGGLGSEKLWDEVPGAFGLPSWNELKNEL
ncbi:hypothetical protein C8R46DRAFT_1341366 [Mycena filopes]|nr:hypothetical protein C8R46DRAFT_1341366 [Mycena filopes]